MIDAWEWEGGAMSRKGKKVDPDQGQPGHVDWEAVKAQLPKNFDDSSWDDGVPGDYAWTTKDSGKREEYASGMRRDTQEDKPRWDLLFAPGMPYDLQPLTRVAGLMQRGAVKYGDNNWTLANSPEELNRFKASAARHFAQWMTGQTDEDHMAAVWFNLQAHAYVQWKLENVEASFTDKLKRAIDRLEI